MTTEDRYQITVSPPYSQSGDWHWHVCLPNGWWDSGCTRSRRSALRASRRAARRHYRQKDREAFVSTWDPEFDR